MSDNKKKRIDKVSVPQKPLKAPKAPFKLIKGVVLPKLPKDLIVLPKPPKAPKDPFEPDKAFVPPGSPKPPPKNYKMP